MFVEDYYPKSERFSKYVFSDLHPILFYLHNIRSGLKSEPLLLGTQWSTYIFDNKHTYIGYINVPVNLYNKSLKVQYEVKGIKNFEDPSAPPHTKIYTISWNALKSFNRLSRRHGEIKITSDGIIQSLLIRLPKQLHSFSIKDDKILNQPITLLIEKISNTSYRQILEANHFSST